MEDIIICQKRGKQLKLVFLGIVMLIMCGICIAGGIVMNNLLFIAVGIFGMMFFGLCFIYIIYRLINPGTILAINDRGIIDQSAASSLGEIAWEEIKSFHITNVMGNKFISVILKDEEKTLSRLPKWKRKLLKSNILLGYEPVSITLQSTDADINEVLNILLTRLHTHITFHEKISNVDNL